MFRQVLTSMVEPASETIFRPRSGFSHGTIAMYAAVSRTRVKGDATRWLANVLKRGVAKPWCATPPPPNPQLVRGRNRQPTPADQSQVPAPTSLF